MDTATDYWGRSFSYIRYAYIYNNFTNETSFDDIKNNKLFYLKFNNDDYFKMTANTTYYTKGDRISYDNNNFTQVRLNNLIPFEVYYLSQSGELKSYSSCMISYKLLILL